VDSPNYEIGVHVRTGKIVWVNGPFRGGNSDITICRSKLLDCTRREDTGRLGLYWGESNSDTFERRRGYREQQKAESLPVSSRASDLKNQEI
jgi:hypothetical protein